MDRDPRTEPRKGDRWRTPWGVSTVESVSVTGSVEMADYQKGSGVHLTEPADRPLRAEVARLVALAPATGGAP